MRAGRPTSDDELSAVLGALVAGAREALGAGLVGAYLQGSFAVGDWDRDSDVDFLIVVERDVSEAELAALQVLHARLYALESAWAQHLEGSYFPRDLLRRGDPERRPLCFLDNTSQVLVRSAHDNTLVVRWVTREYGITLAGPAAETLIEPVAADDLRAEVWRFMQERAADIFAGRYPIENRWAQPFVVLSYCRMLQTLRTGRVGSKLAGARWACEALDGRWAALIQRAWADRPDPSLKVRLPAEPDERAATLAFVRYTLDVGREWSGARAAAGG